MPAKADGLRITGLSVRFGGVRALSDFDLTVPVGSILGIAGPNGGGKTTLLNCISGTTVPQSGSIRLASADLELVGRRPHEIAGLGIARTFQQAGLVRDLSVADLVMLGRHARIKYRFAGCLIGLPLLTGAERVEREAAMAALRYMNLEQYADVKVSDLPYGLAKQADVARAIAMDPCMMLFDEPASGLSDQERRSLDALITQINAELGVTIIIVEHDLRLLENVCHSLVVLESGTEIAQGEPAAVLRDPHVAHILLGAELPAEESRLSDHPL